MKPRPTVPVWRVRSRTVESWRASAWFATVWLSCALWVAPAQAWVATQSDSPTAAPYPSSVTPAAAPVTSVSPISSLASDELGLRLLGMPRVLPQAPDPVQLPPDLSAEELRGGHGFALALSIFSGVLITATLVLLFGLWARQHWFDEAAPSRRPSPSRRSSPSQR